jgi:DNA-binding response OmpR family regulator
MNQDTAKVSVLLVEAEPSWRDLERDVLGDAGFEVMDLPQGEDPVRHAARTKPHVVVIHLGIDQPYQSDIVDRFQADPTTRTIPVVAVAIQEKVVAEAQAGANVRKGVVAPFDIAALEAAVAAAASHPPPSAVLPASPVSVSPAVAFAAEELLKHTRDIILRTVEDLRRDEPYRSRFAELTTGLVDSLGVIFGAIAVGLQRGLAPSTVFTDAELQHSIDEHVRLRRGQGLDLVAVIREDQLLTDQVVAFLEGLVGQNGLTAEDALELTGRVRNYTSDLLRLLAEKYPSGPSTA